MDWKQLPSVMAGIDINLMPLEDSIFHCSKSENKWMEAALVKVPSVMSRNREMEGVIEMVWMAGFAVTRRSGKSAHNADRGKDSQNTDG